MEARIATPGRSGSSQNRYGVRVSRKSGKSLVIASANGCGYCLGWFHLEIQKYRRKHMVQNASKAWTLDIRVSVLRSDAVPLYLVSPWRLVYLTTVLIFDFIGRYPMLSLLAALAFAYAHCLLGDNDPYRPIHQDTLVTWQEMRTNAMPFLKDISRVWNCYNCEISFCNNTNNLRIKPRHHQKSHKVFEVGGSMLDKIQGLNFQVVPNTILHSARKWAWSDKLSYKTKKTLQPRPFKINQWTSWHSPQLNTPVLSKRVFATRTDGFEVSPTELAAERCEVPMFIDVKLLHLIANQLKNFSALPFMMKMQASLSKAAIHNNKTINFNNNEEHVICSIFM